MQTFLPYSNFADSARVLDYRRLGKQRVETWQILNTLRYGGAWKNHPAVLMWKAHEHALAIYGLCMCQEWIRRGYKDTLTPKISSFITNNVFNIYIMPYWADKKFCDSHKSNLLRKNPEYYSQFMWDVPNDLPYVWPVKKD